LNVPVMQIVIYSCIVSALWFGGNMVVSGSMTTGGLISFLSYITQILMSLMMLSMMFVQFILSRASVSRICEVLDEVPAVRENGGASEAARAAGGLSVEFDDVSFSYSEGAGKEVLSGISVSIPAGATVGIIGGTGSSKSTLVQLIPRLYDVSSGSVRVGGIDVRDWRLGSLRKNVAVVLQKSVLFSGTIAENMRWGNEDATDSEIEEACAASDAHSFVSALPDGYGTVIGQGGVNLSGGQRQRLCIARALLKKPAVLILDDSTSAVDTATDLRIRGALRSALPGATKIIIAQRIASVADSDFIIVMDGGRVCGIGTHEELLAGCAIYREVYESQMSGE
ncbi:ABC transporter ATP-binding protein, partial [Treponema saccharophilum]|uniref:ABC transporter ATP-binding protein n=1 Tax=Treponema saccharophilum TaxID=165 RepID=UPI00386A6166